MREPPPPFATDSLAHHVFHTMRALGREFGRHAQSAGISRSWGMILGQLAHNPEGMTATALRQALGVTAASISKTLGDMERSGLVTRTPHPEDARALLVHLTAVGRALLDEFPRILAAIEERAFAGFSAAERASLQAMLERILANLGEAAEQLQDDRPIKEEEYLG